MTESEAWKALAFHLGRGNTQAALVIADLFQELGKQEVASFLRWAYSHNRLPYIEQGQWWQPEIREDGQRFLLYEFSVKQMEEHSHQLARRRMWYSD